MPYTSTPRQLASLQLTIPASSYNEAGQLEEDIQMPEIWLAAIDNEEICRRIRSEDPLIHRTSGNNELTDIVHEADSVLREFLNTNPGKYNLNPRMMTDRGEIYIRPDDIVASSVDDISGSRVLDIEQPPMSGAFVSPDGEQIPDMRRGALNHVFSYPSKIYYHPDRQLIRVIISTKHYELRNTEGMEAEFRDGQWWRDAEVREMGSFNVNTEIPVPNYSKKAPFFRGRFKKYIDNRTTRGEPVKVDRPEEATALETLREMISETDFRKYVKYGFISVPGENGKIYQIFKDKWHTKVWKDGVVIEEVCARLTSEVPATDNVIAFKIMLDCDENEFKEIGNVYKMKKVA